MRENDTQKPDTSPPHMKSNALEEGNDPEEEPDQQLQDKHIRYSPSNEWIRLVIIGVDLLTMMLSFLVFLCTGNVLPLFITMVVVFLSYRYIDRHLDTLERSRH